MKLVYKCSECLKWFPRIVCLLCYQFIIVVMIIIIISITFYQYFLLLALQIRHGLVLHRCSINKFINKKKDATKL